MSTDSKDSLFTKATKAKNSRNISLIGFNASVKPFLTESKKKLTKINSIENDTQKQCLQQFEMKEITRDLFKS